MQVRYYVASNKKYLTLEYVKVGSHDLVLLGPLPTGLLS